MARKSEAHDHLHRVRSSFVQHQVEAREAAEAAAEQKRARDEGQKEER